jgi:hypothetical protein
MTGAAKPLNQEGLACALAELEARMNKKIKEKDMKVVGISGSARKDGNTAIAVRRLLEYGLWQGQGRCRKRWGRPGNPEGPGRKPGVSSKTASQMMRRISSTIG